VIPVIAPPTAAFPNGAGDAALLFRRYLNPPLGIILDALLENRKLPLAS